MNSNTPILLSDEDMKHFIQHGFVVVQSSLYDSVHKRVFRAANRLYTKGEGNPGNNILPAIPELAQVLADPAVDGALVSLLGRGYMLHPHRHGHESLPGRKAQKYHQDSYFGYTQPRHHQTQWVMAMYFPQKTTLEMGPTGIVPCTQCVDTVKGDQGRRVDEVPREWGTEERLLDCEAGTVAFIHYDLWHRGTANTSKNKMRFMFKFQFVRTEMPTEPSWDSDGTDLTGAWVDEAPPLVSGDREVKHAQADNELDCEGQTQVVRDLAACVRRHVSTGQLVDFESEQGVSLREEAKVVSGRFTKHVLATVRNECSALWQKESTPAERKLIKQLAVTRVQQAVDELLARSSASGVVEDRQASWRYLWQWHCGTCGTGSDDGSASRADMNLLLRQLSQKADLTRVRVAYELGRAVDARGDAAGVIRTMTGRKAEPYVIRTAARALVSSANLDVLRQVTARIAQEGDVAAPWLEWMCFAVGGICSARSRDLDGETGAEVVDVLATVLSTPGCPPSVQSSIVRTLGLVPARFGSHDVLLCFLDKAMPEPEQQRRGKKGKKRGGAKRGGAKRFQPQMEALLALRRHSLDEVEVNGDAVRTVVRFVSTPNRYVVGYAVEVLRHYARRSEAAALALVDVLAEQRGGGELVQQVRDHLHRDGELDEVQRELDELMLQRWCALTTRKSLF